MNRTLLIVDDNEDVRQQLKWGLSSEPYTLVFAQGVEEALEKFREHSPQAVTLDLGLPPRTEDASQGFKCLEELRRISPTAKIIVITGFDSREYARRAVDLGAYDFFLKPIDLDELKVMIRRAFHLFEIEQERPARKSAAPRAVHPAGMIGDSTPMREVLAHIEKVAASDVPVLIQGESGTGKELVARAIHELSPRKSGPMVCINCGAVPENLIESEFFGHERGSFTGAVSTVRGKVEYADNGLLFLDEIGELPANLQVKLLRFLQEMVFQRVGGRKNLEVNVRVVAATNIDIQEAMRNGSFREDLFYRIGVVSLKLPPLRERGKDVILLAEHFLRKHHEGTGSAVSGFTQDALDALSSHSWPGNVRELENTVRRAMVMSNSTTISAADLGLTPECPSDLGSPIPANATLKEARSLVEKQMVEAALGRSGGNILKAAEALGISRPTFYDLLRKHGIAL
ncbi:PEP-CTERM-box response regulator transcription factor [Fundidesulfovibrio terrae]|uniref:PEP-CTERM-box response regulator transcription factor n=1 Tax=Fundidesulfovibrio terrae TaxID=2922866 RepID=UPI001FAF3047|nr:PEP-CTERM-box response regulator transcription factor [Fundidesulfovibrio terrae]